MLILAIDTTSSAGSVALLRDLDVVSQVASADAEPYSTRLFRDVERVMHDAGMRMPDIELFAVASGPGSFTGVRVGLAAVKAWAEVYRKPVAPVSALEAIAFQAASSDSLIAGIADAHRGQLFAGLYQRAEYGMSRRGEDVVMPPAECFAYLAEQAEGAPFVIRTTAAQVVQTALVGSPAAGARVDAADPALAPVIGKLAYARALRGDVVDALTLDAHYVRRSDAELLWHDHS
ncbi:MAG TPA: tRNA (adenosine(37)-N6)-threonylcarbamoyltransferase complex dimerization subunit type 1 TsaB [Candidatus Acidoferrales bacterium]|nr:tRNA (adenosine(37)-N6)-threonylcarbamoyltransferase complex dimerization subunit type 1 TsaB [Candidatus Acidoferrales bacterium]